MQIARPVPVEQYKYMGGVDKSDQYLSYHNVLRKTVRYWKTLFYHMIDVAVVNAFVLYNILALLSGCRTISENDFRDELVLQIINRYGNYSTQDPTQRPGRPLRSDCRVQHGSVLGRSKRRCQYCKLTGMRPPKLTQESALTAWESQHSARPPRMTAIPCGTHHHLMECVVYGLHTMNQSKRRSLL